MLNTNPPSSIRSWDEIHNQSENPFNVDRPYEWIVELAEQNCIRGDVLDAGCGGGHNSIHLASLGYRVLGVDISKVAIEQANVRKSKSGIDLVDFVCADVTTLCGFDRQFDTIVDIGCFHSLHDQGVTAYMNLLQRSCREHAHVFMRAFSDSNPVNGKFPRGGPRCSREFISAAFSKGWEIQRLEEKQITLHVPGKTMESFAWFCQIEKTTSA